MLYKDPWILCDTERYLEKVAVDCRGVRAELLCSYWAIGLCIVYSHTQHSIISVLHGELADYAKLSVRFNNCKAAL